MQNPSKKFTEYYNNVANFYSDSLSNEIVELQRPVILPYINEEYSCYQLMHAYKEAECEYRVPEEWYTDTLANFYIPLLSPMVKNGESTMLIHNAPDVSNFLTVGGEFETTEYTEQNYIELVIPRHLVLIFRKEIPKKTKFLCNFTGGSTAYKSMNITGIAYIGEELVMEPYKPLTWAECVAAAGGEDNVPFWLMDRVEKRIEEYNDKYEEFSHVFEDKVEQVKEARGENGEVMYV